jgi:hypothetical protein
MDRRPEEQVLTGPQYSLRADDGPVPVAERNTALDPACDRIDAPMFVKDSFDFGFRL